MAHKFLFGFLLLLLASVGWAAPAAGQAPTSPDQAQQKKWTINVKQADIRAFIRQVADMTGKNFVLDPRVRAKNVTVISRKALTADEVYQLFLSVLQVNGYAAIPSGGVVKIVPSTTAKSYNLPVLQGKVTDEQGLVTEVLPLHGLSATEMVPVLRPLVPQYGHLAAVASANALVVSDHEDNIKRLRTIVARLENEGSAGLAVIELKHAWVGDIIKQLQSLIPQAGAKGRGAAAGGKTVLIADERTNRLLVRGDRKTRHQIRMLVSQLDVADDGQQGNVQVVRLDHGNAKEMAALLNKMFGGAAAKGKKGNPEARVTVLADESLNALVVKADASKMKDLRAIIEELDARRAQVLIEAAIVDVSADKAHNLGVQWATGDVDTGVGGTNFSSAGLSVNEVVSALIGQQSGAAVAPPSLSDGATIGFGGLDDNGELEWAGLIQALASTSSVNLLSTPSILTLDNQEASIIVGKNVPFVTGRYTNTNNSVSNPFQTIQREDVGITLKVTPHLGGGDSMRLELEQEVSSVLSSSANGITTRKRKIDTTVLADSGETVVLGGLIQDNIEKTVSKVPLLGDIPFLGALFRSTHKKHVRSNLIVFLRPTIVRDNDTLVSLTRDKYMGVVSLQFQLNDRGELEQVTDTQPLPLNVEAVFEGRRPLPADFKRAIREHNGRATTDGANAEKDAAATSPAE